MLSRFRDHVPAAESHAGRRRALGRWGVTLAASAALLAAAGSLAGAPGDRSGVVGAASHRGDGVILVDFQVSVVRNLVVEAAWETSSEAGLLGFHLHRSPDPDAGYVRVTDELVPARGSTVVGAAYALEDEPGIGVFHYRLEIVDQSGVAEWVAQAQVEVVDERSFIYQPHLQNR